MEKKLKGLKVGSDTLKRGELLAVGITGGLEVAEEELESVESAATAMREEELESAAAEEELESAAAEEELESAAAEEELESAAAEEELESAAVEEELESAAVEEELESAAAAVREEELESAATSIVDVTESTVSGMMLTSCVIKPSLTEAVEVGRSCLFCCILFEVFFFLPLPVGLPLGLFCLRLVLLELSIFLLL